MSNMVTKTYAAKSSVTRALKQAGIDPDTVIIDQDGDGQWYAHKKAAPKPAAQHFHQRSTDKTPRNGNCAKVWEIADSMPDAKRKEVVNACVEAGIPLGTSKTQYQHWFVSKKG